MTARCNLCMGALKIFESPWVRPRLLLPKFLIGFCSDRLDPMNVRTKVKFVALPIAEIIRVLKKFGQSLDTPTLLFLLFFSEAFVRIDLWMYQPNLKFVALPIPEIIGGTQKILDSPCICPHSLSPKFLIGFCSDGPCEYNGQSP